LVVAAASVLAYWHLFLSFGVGVKRSKGGTSNVVMTSGLGREAESEACPSIFCNGPSLMGLNTLWGIMCYWANH
jgi:hypothetical protein